MTINNHLVSFFLSAFFLFIALPCYGQQTFPYFASLKHDRVNLRTGPGDRFPISWVYQEKHYPLEVIDEFDLWRQVREIDGTMGWIHKTQLSGARYALILDEEKLLDKPMPSSRAIAIVQKGTTGRILKCPENTEYCLLSFGTKKEETKGWLHKTFFWGVKPNEIID